jgi:hypothetical protein
MKKMRGFADPITLGFILTALIAGAGVNTSTKPADKVQAAQPQVAAVSTQRAKVMPAPVIIPTKLKK